MRQTNNRVKIALKQFPIENWTVQLARRQLKLALKFADTSAFSDLQASGAERRHSVKEQTSARKTTDWAYALQTDVIGFSQAARCDGNSQLRACMHTWRCS